MYSIDVKQEEKIRSEIFKQELKKKFQKFSSYWWQDYYEEITAFVVTNIISNLVNKKIIEAGSGSGKASILLGEYLEHITLLDIAKNALKYAKLLAKSFGVANISFKEGNIFNMPYNNNTFGFTWNIGTIEHYGEDDIKKILTEMIRVTEDGGYVAIGTPNFYSGPILRAWLASRTNIIKGYKLNTENFYSSNSLVQLINGIDNVTIEDLKISTFGSFLPMETSKIWIKFAKNFEKIFCKNKFLTLISFKVIKHE